MLNKIETEFRFTVKMILSALNIQLIIIHLKATNF